MPIVGAGNAGERRRGRIGEPRELDEANVVEIAQRFARLPVVDLAARVGEHVPEVGLGERGILRVEGEQHGVRRDLGELAPQQREHVGRAVEAERHRCRAAEQDPLAGECTGESLLQRVVAADDDHALRAVGLGAARELNALALDRQRQRVDVRRKGVSLVELVQRDRPRQVAAGRCDGLEVVAHQRPDDDARAASRAFVERGDDVAIAVRNHVVTFRCEFAAAAANPALTASAARP